MDNRLVTKCNGCIFAITDENKAQTGCELNRLEKLGILGKDDDEYFICDRFCAAHRPQQWLDDLSFEDQLNPEHSLMEDLYPNMGFFIKLNSDSDNAIADLEKTLSSIVAACHKKDGKPLFLVVINSKVEYNNEIWNLFVSYFGEESDTNYHIVQLESTTQTAAHIIDEAFIHAQNGWAYITTSGEEIPHDVLDNIHNMVSVDLKRFVAIEPYNGFDGFVFPTFLFKFLNGNRTKIFQDEISDGRQFLDKLKSYEGEVKTIYTWEEFNAS